MYRFILQTYSTYSKHVLVVKKLIIELSKKKIIIISFTLLISLIGIISLTHLNFLDRKSLYCISFLRQIIGIICLIYLPGALIVRILKIHVSDSEELVYSVGLSLSLIMISGFLMNMIYPLIGLSKPISLWVFLLTFSVINFVLLSIIYISNAEHVSPRTQLNYRKYNWIYLLLPIMAVIGSKYIWIHNNSLITLALILIIAIIPMAAITDKLIKEQMYTFIIYMVALALLLHNTMVSPYPLRINVDGEYFYQQLVFQNEFWDHKLPGASNTVLSIVMIAPIFSKVLNMSVFWLFKLIYPIIFSFVPVILYQIYSKQINKKYAFISTLFFMFFFYFYTETPLLRRQEISILYYSLIILLLIDQNIPLVKKRALSTIFLMCLVISHYTTASLCLLLFTFAYLIDKHIITKLPINILIKQKTRTFVVTNSDKIPKKYSDLSKVSKNYLIIFIVFLISWITYVGSSYVLNNITLLGEAMYLDFFTQSEKSKYISSAFGIGFFELHPVAMIYAILQYFSQLCIIIGSIGIIINQNEFKRSYVSLIISAFIFLSICIIAPHLSVSINIVRIYFILLIILSPLCIIGGHILWTQLTKFITYIQNKYNVKYYKKINFKNDSIFLLLFVFIFLIPYFLCNIGFVFDIGNFDEEAVQIPKSPSLNLNYNTGYHTEKEVIAAIQASKITNKNLPIYGDKYIGYDLISSWNTNSKVLINRNIEERSYLFLRKWNIISHSFKLVGADAVEQDIININENFLKNRPKIYDNNNAIIYGPIPFQTSRGNSE